jgi:hypothetical protein
VLRDEGIPPEQAVITLPRQLAGAMAVLLAPPRRPLPARLLDWEQAKVDRLREYGYAVEVLHPGIEKAVEASEVRSGWPPGKTGGLWCRRPSRALSKPQGGAGFDAAPPHHLDGLLTAPRLN